MIRAHRIGSSDAAAILGLSRWHTAHDVYLRLTDRLEEQPDIESAAMTLGKMMEAPLVDWGAQEAGVKVRKNVVKVNGNLSAQHDALAVSAPMGIEAKTAGVNYEDWGPDGSDEIPAYYAAQIIHQAAVSSLDMIVVPVAFVGWRRDIRLYRVPVAEAERAAFLDFMERWFKKHVEGDTPPLCAPTLPVARLTKRTPGKVCPASPAQAALWARYGRMKALAGKIKDRTEEAQAALLAGMGDAEALVNNGRKITAKWQDRKGYTVEVKPSRYQVLREGKADE